MLCVSKREQWCVMCDVCVCLCVGCLCCVVRAWCVWVCVCVACGCVYVWSMPSCYTHSLLECSLDDIVMEETRVIVGDTWFDVLYIAMGIQPRVALAVEAGAELDPDDGRVRVGLRQVTTVPNLCVRMFMLCVLCVL